jgi:Zn-dependent peptidase ImmA (M78 family)
VHDATYSGVTDMPQEVSDLLPVTPAVITWARERAGFSLDEAAKYFKKIEAWEQAQGAPTYPQLEQMAEKFKCPVAVFFFPTPPDVPTIEKSFRTIAPTDLEQLPRFLRTLLRRAQAMQLNLVELNDGDNPADRLITRDLAFNLNATIAEIADELRAYLGVTLEQQTKCTSIDDAFELWRDAFAGVGVFVFKDAFHAEQYFGFCLYDDEFPIIYVNNSSTKSRQIFTLFHELGHLLFHTSGIDVGGQGIAAVDRNAARVEVICNSLTGAFLVPEAAFFQALGRMPASRDTAATLAGHFNVSREVIYRRFLDRGMISDAEYRDAAEIWRKQMKQQSGGGDYYNTMFSYLGTRYIDLAFQRYYQNRISDVQLSDYLNIKPRNLPAFELKYAGGV